MNPKEIASRLNGFSTPIGGVSWTALEAEVTIAKRIVTLLEDKRVLYRPPEAEILMFCAESVVQIRRELTKELAPLDSNTKLAQNIKAMLATCRRFSDRAQELSRSEPPDIQALSNALGEMRGILGVLIALIAKRNKLVVNDELASIFPPEPSDSDGVEEDASQGA